MVSSSVNYCGWGKGDGRERAGHHGGRRPPADGEGEGRRVRVPAEAHLPGELRVPEPAGGGLRLSQPPHLFQAGVGAMDCIFCVAENTELLHI